MYIMSAAEQDDWLCDMMPTVSHLRPRLKGTNQWRECIAVKDHAVVRSGTEVRKRLCVEALLVSS